MKINISSAFIVLVLCMKGISLFAITVRLEGVKKVENISVLIENTIDAIASDNGGNIFLLDSKACAVHKLNEGLEYLCQFGRKGQGPGDLFLPYALNVDKKNNVMVCTRINGISAFNSLGDPIDSPLKKKDIQSVRYVNNQLYCCEQGVSTNPIARKQVVIDDQGEVLFDSINPGPLPGVTVPGGGFISWMHPTCSNFLISASAYGYAALARSRSSKIALLGSDNEGLRFIEIEKMEKPFSDNEKKYLFSIIDREAPPDVAKYLQKQVPETKNNFEAILLSPTGLFVVGVSEDICEKSQKAIDAYSKNGTKLGSFKLPETPMWVDKSRIYCIESDDEGSSMLCVYRYETD